MAHTLRISLSIMGMLALLACHKVAPGQEVADTCSVPEAPKVLENALCEGSVSALSDALLELKDAERSPTFLEVLPILDRVWMRDTSLGHGVDWQKLDDSYFRTQLAASLAPQVTLRRSKVPLKELQTFAINASRRDLEDRGASGIHLLGSTHTPGQVAFLREIAQSSGEQSQRDAAIYALGGLCEVEAQAALEQMRADSSRTDAERRAAASAIRNRELLSDRICQLAGVPR